MRKTIYLDLDGTLLNVFDRLYKLYTFLLTEERVKKHLSKEEYITTKRENIKEEEIIKTQLSKEKRTDYHHKREKLIESPAFLQYDFLPDHISKTLDKLQENYDLILITKRKSEQNLRDQLKRLEMDHFFRKILVTGEKYQSKAEIIREEYLSPHSIIIGDTEEDIITGKKLNITTIAITSGMREKDILKRYNPDFIIENLSLFSEIEAQISKLLQK